MTAALRPGGVLRLDLFAPLISAGRSEPRSFLAATAAPPGWEVVKTSWTERDPETQVLRIHECLSVNGRESTQDLILHVVDARELEGELRQAGFDTVAILNEEDARGGRGMVAIGYA